MDSSGIILALSSIRMSQHYIGYRKALQIVIQLPLIFLWVAACSWSPRDIPSNKKTQNPDQSEFVLTSPLPGAFATPTKTPFQPAINLPLSSPEPSSNPNAELQPITTIFPPTTVATPPLPQTSRKLWIDPHLPLDFQASLVLPANMSQAESSEQADIRLEFNHQSPVSRWIYALVTPFPSLVDNVSADTLRRTWTGETNGPFAGKPLLMDESSLFALRTLWGEPATTAVQVLPAEELLPYAWKNQPAWAIVPFEDLEPRWKVLEIDGQSPMHKDFDAGLYLLNVPISLTGDPALINLANPTLAAPSNRQPDRLTVVVMTGVTALVRSTAFAMEQRGIEYPAGAILSWLKDADLTHISNEVPFAKDCPAPDPFQPGMKFCSHPGYINLLETVGTDIVELTGDHFQDWGTGAMNLTLEMYRERGWLTYGGGANLDQARQAITLDHNGNRLAWIGCNAKGGGFAQASAKQPGAAACNLDWMESEISRLQSEGYLPIVTFQHFEYYQYQAQPDQKRDFRRMAQAGAVIVSGSQAHQPQAMEFSEGAFIHYGLGNLFFDQYEVSLATRQAFIDRHIFYDGRYIGTELLTGMFIDYAKMRPMTNAERNTLLQAIFNASHW